MGKTKAELVEQLDADDTFKPMLEGIGDTEQQMRGFYDLVNAAWARLMCAAAVDSLNQKGKPCA